MIFLFMAGGRGHLETFDPKPLLNKLDGQKRRDDFGEAQYSSSARRPTAGTRRTFKKYGESGIEVSDLFPHTAQCVDDLAVIRPVTATWSVHSAAQYGLSPAGSCRGFRAWGRGSFPVSAPKPVAAVVRRDGRSRRRLEAGQPMYQHGFLPGRLPADGSGRAGGRCSISTCPQASIPAGGGRTLDLIRDLNRATLDPADHEFSARINAYDLAFKMQTEAPEVLDRRAEPRETLMLYGIDREPTHDYGRRCLSRGSWSSTACTRLRRLGRRTRQPPNGDTHSDIEENHLRKAAETDQPVAGLLKDLKRRGLLESTLVLWGG